MKKLDLRTTILLSSVFAIAGCVVRTYPLTRDRVDQNLGTGNRGYLTGQAPSISSAKETKPTRTTQIVEIELRNPIRFENKSKASSKKTMGNRGYITESVAPAQAPIVPTESIEKYTVQKGDTLQKISQKYYGTTKKWTKIYDANKDVLKAANKIYPGQVLNVPLSSSQVEEKNQIKETTENLK